MKSIQLFFPIVLIAVFLIGWWVGSSNSGSVNVSHQTEYRMGGYNLTNPLLDCDSPFTPADPKISRVQKQIDSYLKYQKSSLEASVYFRHLGNGPSFGINENAKFSPASLLKIPIMMALYKQHQSQPILDQIIVVKDIPAVPVADFTTPSPLKAGSEYTIGQLIEYMITYSDNTATVILKQYLGNDRLLTTYRDLGIDLSSDLDSDFLSTKTYSTFFRILFNSSYLNRDYSEQALKLLTQTTFNRGLTAKLPTDIKIAHKYGIRVVDGSRNQLHDCGIIYYPQNPYLLCVMTKGNNLNEQSSVISQISLMVYDTITDIYRQSP